FLLLLSPSVSFSVSCSRAHRALHSFPTRRSSDLVGRPTASSELLRSLIPHRPGQFHDAGQTWKYPLPQPIYPIVAAIRYKRQSRSEEHTSELQSRFDLVCRLLLEKKNRQQLSADE